jgi:uncharacterized phage-associated protein
VRKLYENLDKIEKNNDICATNRLNQNSRVMKNVSKYDALKIKAVFLYVLNKMNGANMLSALKIVYFANKKHLKSFGRPLIEDDFIAMPLGPVPSFLYDAIKCEKGERYLNRPNVDILKGSFIPVGQHRLSPTETADMDELSTSDILCIDASIEENGGRSARELTDKSHSDSAWKNAESTSLRLMDTIQMAIDEGTSQDMLEIIKSQIDFANLCN